MFETGDRVYHINTKRAGVVLAVAMRTMGRVGIYTLKVQLDDGEELNGNLAGEFRVEKPSDRQELSYEVGDRVFLTFSEARGDLGTVTDTGTHTGSGGAKSYEYVNVKLDNGTQTGPMPITCVAPVTKPEPAHTYEIGDRVVLDFDHAARGLVGTVTATDRQTFSDEGLCEVVDVRLDSGSQTGPIPSSYVTPAREAPEPAPEQVDLANIEYSLITTIGNLNFTAQGLGLVNMAVRELRLQGLPLAETSMSSLPDQLDDCAKGLQDGLEMLHSMAEKLRGRSH